MTDQNEPNLEKLKKAKIPTRRVRMMMVDPTAFMSFFKKGMVLDKRVKIIEGAPADAKLVAVVRDDMRNGMMMVLESPSYDEVPINVLPPIEPVQIEIGVPGATKKKKEPRKK